MRPGWWSVGFIVLAGCYHSAAADDDAAGDARADGDAADDVADTAADVVDATADDAGEVDAYAGPWPILFRLRFISDVPESVWVAAWDAADPSGHWLRIDHAGTVLRKAESCAVCGCDDCPGCPVCGAPCMDATELPSGGSVEYLWNGMEYPLQACPAVPSTVCEQPAICGPVGPYTARVCWGTAVTGTPCNETVENLECADVPFTVPDPDGVVEYTIDRGG